MQVVLIKLLLAIVSLLFDLDRAEWDESIVGGLDFINKSVLQIPFLLMTLMRYVTPTLDEMCVDPSISRFDATK